MADTRAAIAAQLSDLGYGPAQIAGIIGNLQHESSLDPNAVGDNGTSFGLAQWHSDRWDALKNFAAKNGSDPSDVSTQVNFLHNELQGLNRLPAKPLWLPIPLKMPPQHSCILRGLLAILPIIQQGEWVPGLGSTMPLPLPVESR
jgi:hypothetical protein